MSSLSLRGIGKRFGATQVLQDVTLEVADGEFVTLVGPSGCGKSTLLRVVAGLERQDAGEVWIDGRCVDGVPPARRQAAMVFQSYALYPHMSAEQNVALPLEVRRLSFARRLPLVGRLLRGVAAERAAIRAEVRRVAEQLEIADLLARRPAQLSGGQQQRVALARAMVRRPSVFLMDEPLSSLDAKLRAQMRVEISDLHRRLGATFVYVTHDQTEAMTMSTRVAVMHGGRIVQCAAPVTLYEEPATLEVAEMIGTPKINTLPGTAAAGGRVAVGQVALDAGVSAPEGSPLTVAVRPEHLAVRDAGERLAGTVRGVEDLGPELLVRVALSEPRAELTARLPVDQRGRHRIGDPIGLGILAGRALAFDSAGRRVPQPSRVGEPARALAGSAGAAR
jgi:multiple sugar transport system ATP-binding protein